MTHNRYRNLILDEESLSLKEQQELTEHLLLCHECARFKQSADHSINLIVTSAEIRPPANFTRSWLVSFEARKREQEKKQARQLILGLSGGILTVVLAMLIILLPDFSLISLAAGFISTMIAILNTLEKAFTVLTTLFQSIRPGTLILTLAIAIGWILLACFTLGLSVWKLAIKKIEVKQ